MGMQVQKSRTICGTCKHWCGPVSDFSSTSVEVNCGPYDKFKCGAKHGNHQGQEQNYQGQCIGGGYERKY